MNDDAHTRKFEPEDAYIRRLDPDWITMVSDVEDAQSLISKLVTSNHRQERYLVGGWSDDGETWIVGVREKIDHVEKLARWFWVIAAGVWSIFAAIIATHEGWIK